ncbi:MAG: DUF362 domain-containing protein [Candidatus Thorarchaeota archaeon]
MLMDGLQNAFPSFLGEFQNNLFGATRVKESSSENIRKGLIKLIDLLKWRKIIGSDTRILIKPNFTAEYHHPGVTTSPQVIRGLVDILSKWGNEIAIIESNGGSWLFNASSAAKNHGIINLTREYNISWINISDLPTKKITETISNRKISLNLPADIEKTRNVLISLPVFKSHCMTKITLGLKNLWGLIPSELRLLQHSKLNWYLPLIAKYYNHQLTLIDGIVGLEGNGPMFGNPIKMNILFGGNNPIISDIVASWLMKINPKSVDHIKSYARYSDTSIDGVISQIPLSATDFQKEMKFIRTPSNYLDLLTFKSQFLSKIVFDSSLTPLIYYLFNFVNGDRKSIPPKKLREKFLAQENIM